MQITGRGNYYGYAELKYRIQPNDITDLKITAVTETTMTLTWTKPAGSDYVRLYEYFEETDTRKTINAKITGNTYTVTGLTPGKHEFWAATSAISDNPAENNKVYNCAKWGTVTGWTKATAVQSATASGDQVTVAFNGQPVVDGSQRIIVAAYEESGKMIASNVATVDNRVMKVTVQNASSAYCIKVFVINAASAPVMKEFSTK